MDNGLLNMAYNINARVNWTSKLVSPVIRMAIWLRGLERWYLVLGGVAVGRGFEPQSDLELSFAEILI
jgi:hypothetical protein